MSQSDIINSRQIQWFPGHMTKTLRLMEKEIRNVDCVLQILDARIPLSSLNPEIERITAGKPHLYVLNKSDLADPEITKQWLAYFKSAGAGCIAMDSKQRGRATATKGLIEKELSALMERRRSRGMVGAAIRVMIVGIPNVGKSTLLSMVSAARPKIANYHFTTLYPNLGVVYVDEGVSFVMADIPGIIEGAAEGAGLGHDFLRHIDRCRLLVHVVDVSGSEGRDPVEDFDAINAELSQYSPDLATRPQIVVANKTDIMEDESLLEKLRAHVEPLGYPLFALSAASHTGTRELVLKIAEKLSTLPPVTVYEPEYVPKPVKIDASEPLKITVEDNTYIVEGKWLERLMSNINFGDYESRMFFDKMLRENGVFQQLEDLGIKDGDIVSMYELEFEYQH